MSVMAVFAIAVALAITAVTLVVARQLWRTVKGLQVVLAKVTERLAPLQADLTEELQITSAEAEQLQSSLEDLRSSRRE